MVFAIKNKYRIKFEKIDRLRFIGHLDLLKLMQRTVQRSRLPIAYSNGFNPHQIMSFASPLALSVESVSEYLDIELLEDLDETEILNRLNNSMPNGLKVLQVKKLKESDKSAASLLRAADYSVKVKEDVPNIKEKIDETLQKESILVMKKTKSSNAETDIKEDIFELSYDEENDSIFMKISTGSQKNIKPEIVINGIFGKDVKISIKRLEMYYEKDGEFLPLI